MLDQASDVTDPPETHPDLRVEATERVSAWAAPPLIPPQGPPASPIELWKPVNIGVASVLLGFPGAVVLAALNWHRMGGTGKAIVHVSAIVIGTWALVMVNAGYAGLLVGVMVGYYLYRAQRRDQAPFLAAGRVRERNGLLGLVVAIVGTVLTVGSGTLIADTVLDAVPVDGFTHRGEVFFATHAMTDLCSRGGQTTAYGPSDPIFVTAIMRETVKAGSEVVVQIDGPGMSAGPFPVGIEPPFDCLGGTLTIGPLDPGMYVVRYHYVGQPGAPDLATGMFTVRPGPGGS
jgi:hypothetical protein